MGRRPPWPQALQECSAGRVCPPLDDSPACPALLCISTPRLLPLPPLLLYKPLDTHMCCVPYPGRLPGPPFCSPFAYSHPFLLDV